MLAIWSLVPLPFLKRAWTSGSSQFTVLLKPGLENFEHHFTSVWGRSKSSLESESKLSPCLNQSVWLFHSWNWNHFLKFNFILGLWNTAGNQNVFCHPYPTWREKHRPRIWTHLDCGSRPWCERRGKGVGFAVTHRCLLSVTLENLLIFSVLFSLLAKQWK